MSHYKLPLEGVFTSFTLCIFIFQNLFVYKIYQISSFCMLPYPQLISDFLKLIFAGPTSPKDYHTATCIIEKTFFIIILFSQKLEGDKNLHFLKNNAKLLISVTSNMEFFMVICG